ncbi:tetratricopeptide repeat protein [Lysobacter sp. 2RAF19]
MRLRIALLFLLSLASAMAQAQQPPYVVPTSQEMVLERLPRGYAALEPVPGPRAQPLAQANALLAAAARTGDARLAARAEAILVGIPKQTVQVREARAFAAQHRHAFDDARRLLSAVLVEHPRDSGARLSRAQILLVQGHLTEARSDCTTLVLGIDSEAGLLCVAALVGREGRYDAANASLDQWLAQTARDPQALRSVLVSRAEFAARMGDPRADIVFARALAIDPQDVRTLAAYARTLRARGRNAEALKLLANAPDSDGLALQKTLAAHAIGNPDAPRFAASMRRRYALAHAVGTQPELRDEADFRLIIDNNPAAALELAQKNFRQQRDYEDVDVLLRTARAANRADIVADTMAWLQQSGIDGRRVASR